MMIRRGSYHYFCNDVRVADETWCVETASDGTRTIESTRDASEFGAYFSVLAKIAPTGAAAYQLTFQTRKGTPILKTARYRVETRGVYQQSENGQETAVSAPNDALFFPLMRVFTGQLIAAMISRKEPTTWIVPKLDMTHSLETLFEPDLSQRLVTRDAIESDVFWLSGGPYVAPARLKLRPDGMLHSYEFTPEGSPENWECRYVSSEA